MGQRTRDPDDAAEPLTAAAYERLRRAATTYRESVVVRLCGEVGLSPAEVARVRPDDFRTVSTRAGTHHLLTVVDDEGDAVRDAHVPADVRSAVERYANERGIGGDERVVAVTPRRIQMVVGEVGERAAERSGDDRLRTVSSTDLRGYYARRLVHEAGLDPRVVLAIGPWDGLDALCRHLDPVGIDAVLGSLERAGLGGPTAEWTPEDLGRALASADLPVVVTDADGAVAFANDGLAALTERSGGDLVGEPAAALYHDGARPPAETSDPTRVRLAGPDGDPVPVVRVAAPLNGDPARRGRRIAVFVEREASAERAGEPADRADANGRRPDPDGPRPDPDGPRPDPDGPNVSVGSNGRGDLAVDDGADGSAPADADGTDAPAGASVPARVADTIGALGAVAEVLAAASKRTEVASRVCDRLAATDGYEFAWVGSATGDRGVVSAAWTGIDEATAEALAETATDDVDVHGVAADQPGEVRTLPTGEREAPLRPIETDGDGPGVDAVAVVPITYGDTTHGLLALGATGDDAFGSDERELLASVGWQIGQAITDIKRRNLLLADSVTELEFRVESERAFFVAASGALDAAFELQGLVPGEGGSLLYFVTMRGASPEDVVDFAADADGIENARLIRDYGERYLVEFVVAGEEPATTLTELGGHVTEFTVEDGAQRVTAEFTTETDVRTVFNGFQSAFSESALFSKHEVERPVQTTDGFRRSLEDDLTDKQQSVLRAAYLAGYFEWPRGSTAEELADSIGVSSPTLHNHLRKAQQKLLTAFFDDE
ncbi:bacterio-opsin activator domain-containing protein [Halosimplex pelagicum]|uniref:Helix-turn-helix domain-containing protein n=1 Tax=Halosimplex pelagicum TaxID=869886 RepID=A0A7D5TD82_9EURY|nr:bacterio-opsin activator domain-containing protein [Halosimplex pelagicum]QLH82755.1 helix-turn-helix domain-containing protein [Halosimplex pelagicum]